MAAPRKYGSDESTAWRLFDTSAIVHLASTRADGQPLLRTFHAAVFDDGLVIHAGGEGEKMEMLDRPVVVSTERILVRIPSYFVDRSLACPATTYYESAMARGVLRALDGEDEKAEALGVFMRRHQAEGGYVPITASHPTYGSVLKQLLVAKIEISEIHAKRKLGQNRSRKQIERIAEELWKRGQPGDLEAIEPILDAHPDTPRPAFLDAGDQMRLCPAPREEDLPQALALLKDQYWTLGERPDRLADAHRNATAWVGIRDPSGALVASARANTDGTRHAYVADVVVAPELRGRGLGRALLGFLLDHPMVRRVARIRLGTLDAADFYRRFGFRPNESRTVEMLRLHEFRSAVGG